MKSRLAVSVLFILIAATFASDATAAFKKVRSWAGRGCERRAEVWNRNSALASALQSDDTVKAAMIHLGGDRLLLSQNCAAGEQPRVVGTISPDGKTITFRGAESDFVSPHGGPMQGVVFKLVGSDYLGEGFDFIRTAARQIREVLELMRIK
jgi:hypothetical protein